jgi:hypothetical protein
LHQELLDNAGFKHLNLNDPFIGFDFRDNIAALDTLAGVDMPRHQSSGFHISTKTGHTKLSHDFAPFF